MDESNSAKMATTKAPQLADMNTSAVAGSAPSSVERHLSVIKPLAIIMAVLIFAALAVIIFTIHSRLTVIDATNNVEENELIIPFDSRVTAASLTAKGHTLLVLEDANGQQIWQVDPAGKVHRKTRIVQSR